MKTKILILISFFNLFLASAQTNFEWQVIDSVNKTKNQIYSDTKLFIAENFNSAKSVIQNDDKESGNIYVVGIIKETIGYYGYTYTYYYEFRMSFFMKENKFKTNIDNVKCSSTTAPSNANYSIECIKPFDGENYTGSNPWLGTGGIPKQKQLELMNNLRNSLTSFMNKYVDYIKSKNTKSDW
jgi:hypothetical protein